jgi:predicted nucleic acid-binding protein
VEILVSDTSVLIDLERCALQERVFALDAQIVVPDLLYERELRQYNGEELRRLGLRVESLTGEELQVAQTLRNGTPAITVPDSLALALARERKWILLAGDGAMRRLAAEQQVDCHGVLWLLDQMEQASVATIQQLDIGLRQLAGHPRCRLPRPEITLRLTRYGEALGR